MAVFLLNICKFNQCGMEFGSLVDLIQHIEDQHIDYDPVFEKKEKSKPDCLPLSCVQRYITDATRKENPPLLVSSSTESLDRTSSTGVEMKRKLAIKHHSYSMSSSNRSNTPTGSEMDEDEIMVSESEDSNDSWTTEEFSSEFIMRYGSRSSAGLNGTNEKPFACPVPGCKKRYKNVNGIKYHSKNGHKKDGNRIKKNYKCPCGKSYKTPNKLKSHSLMAHSTGSASDLSLNSSSSSGSSLNSSTQHHSPNTDNHHHHNVTSSAAAAITTLKNSMNVTIKSSKISSHHSGSSSSSSSSSSKSHNTNKNTHGTSPVENHSGEKSKNDGKMPKLAKYDGLGILTPATSPKQQLQQQQQQQLLLLTDNQQQLFSNGCSSTSSSTENLQNIPLTPVSPAPSPSPSSSSATSYQHKKGDES